MRKGATCRAGITYHRTVGVIASVLMMWLCTPGVSIGDNDVSADIEVTPGTHNLTIPPIPDGSEVSEITVTITAAPDWTLVTLDPAPDGWFGTYQRLYDGMSPGEAYGGTFTGELEPEEEPEPVGNGGGEPDYTFTVNATGTSVKPEFRIRPDELTVCVGKNADYVSEKRLDEASPWQLQASNWTLGGNARPPAASSKTFVTNAPGVYAISAETNGLSDTAELTVVQVELEIDLVDEEPDTDPRVSVRDASGLDMSTLSVTINGSAVATNIMTITDISSGSIVVGKKLQFEPTCSMLNLPGSNEVKANISDVAGNAMDEVTQTFTLP